MADEPELLPGNEPADEPTIETEAEQPVSLDQVLETSEPEQQPEPEDDFEELDWDGKKFKAPKGLKDGLMMQADYTRKTQEVAATRKELEAQRERIAQQAKATEAELQSRAQLHHIDAELKRFPEGYDWAAYQQHRQNDPIAADEAWNYYQHLRQQKGEVANQISQAEQARTAEAQQEIAKRLQETAEFARTKIKGWTPETDKQVVEFALSKGATTEDLQRMMSPLVYETLYLARLGEQLLTRQAQPRPQPAPAPLTTVAAKTNAPVRKSLAEMSMEEYAAARKRGVGG